MILESAYQVEKNSVKHHDKETLGSLYICDIPSNSSKQLLQKKFEPTKVTMERFT